MIKNISGTLEWSNASLNLMDGCIIMTVGTVGLMQ